MLERNPETLVVVDHPDNVQDLGAAMAAGGPVLNVLVDVEVGGRRTGVEPGEPAVDLGRRVAGQRHLNLRGLQGYAGHCAHVEGWEARRRVLAPMDGRLMKTRALFERNGLPVEIVTGGLERHIRHRRRARGLTELQSGSYCVMDLDYRRIGGRNGPAYDEFEMALTVLTTVVSRPSASSRSSTPGSSRSRRPAVRSRGGRGARASSTRGPATSTGG